MTRPRPTMGAWHRPHRPRFAPGLSLLTSPPRRPHPRRVGKKPWNARDIDWTAVDWRKRDTEIAEELGCTVASARKARIAAGVEAHPVGRPSDPGASKPRNVRLQWEELDAAAERLGMKTPELLRNIVQEWLDEHR
jgi:hypothetical protein